MVTGRRGNVLQTWEPVRGAPASALSPPGPDTEAWCVCAPGQRAVRDGPRPTHDVKPRAVFERQQAGVEGFCIHECLWTSCRSFKTLTVVVDPHGGGGGPSRWWWWTLTVLIPAGSFVLVPPSGCSWSSMFEVQGSCV